MEQHQLRLELVKLCYKHDKEMTTEVVARARELEAYITETSQTSPPVPVTPEPAPEQPDAKPKGTKKKGDNSIFS